MASAQMQTQRVSVTPPSLPPPPHVCLTAYLQGELVAGGTKVGRGGRRGEVGGPEWENTSVVFFLLLFFFFLPSYNIKEYPHLIHFTSIILLLFCIMSQCFHVAGR